MNSSHEKVGEYTQMSSQPEVYHRGSSDLEVVPPNAPESYSNRQPEEKMNSYIQSQEPARRRIGGVTPFIFWLLIFLIVVLFGAGLGAGLGVGLSKKSSNDAAAR